MTEAAIQTDHAESARERVRRVLIRPLLAEGAVRPKGKTVAEMEIEMQKLAEKLAYLDEPMLATLHEVTRRLMVGPLHNQWPPFLTIWNEAQRLRPPPDDERHIMVSWLRSVEGPAAQAGGYLPELHGWLRLHGRPPGSYAMEREIRAPAAENRREVQRIRLRIADGLATDGERQWLDRYLRHLAYCEALVAQGVEKRAMEGVAC